MLKIIIIASGDDYQKAAALAASTFAVRVPSAVSVSVLLPDREEGSQFLTQCSKQFGFAIEKFPFNPKHQRKFTSQLKCQAFAWHVARLGQKEIALIADADTCCLREIQLPMDVESEILSGKVGMVADIEDRHFRDPSVPWYLAPEERSIYVNSGVIFAAGQARAFFERVLHLSDDPRFLTGPFNDQKVINFALGKDFPGLLIALDRKFNTLRSISEETVIAHFAGGAGLLAQHRRRRDHERKCLTVLKDCGRPIDKSAGNLIASQGT